MSKQKSCLLGKRLVPTSGMSREEWLKLRRKSIGGSDAAGMIGLSRWESPYSVWADKTGRLPDKPETEAMRQGRDLEDYVARRWMQETGKKVRRINAVVYHPQYPYSHADIDRWVVGENAGLECKTTSSLDLRKFEGVEFPEQYYCQCIHYMAVTGADRWYLAVLVFGRGFYIFTLERVDVESEILALMQAETRFWEHYVATDSPPAADATTATADTLEVIWRQGSGGVVELFGRQALLEEYIQLRQEQQLLQERMTAISNTIKADMQSATKATEGLYTISWKPQTRMSFDRARFEKDHPGMDLTGYCKLTESRPFKISKQEEC